jgi:hypothetical protein
MLRLCAFVEETIPAAGLRLWNPVRMVPGAPSLPGRVWEHPLYHLQHSPCLGGAFPLSRRGLAPDSPPATEGDGREEDK